MTETAEFVQRSRNGDKEAFETLVNRYKGLASGIAFSHCGDFHRSEDVAQEAFLTAWQKLSALKNADKFPSWLAAIVRNIALKPQKKTLPLCDELAENMLENDTPLTESIRNERSKFVWQAVSQIPEPYREALILSYREESEQKEIAASLEISEEALRQRLVRARVFLREEIETMLFATLRETMPSQLFTIAVITTLPPLQFMSVVGTAAPTGKAATGFSFAAIFAYVLFFVWLFASSFFLIRKNVINSPTLRSRRHYVKHIFGSVPFFILYFVVFALLNFIAMRLLSHFQLSSSFPAAAAVALTILAVASIYVPYLKMFHKRHKKIIQEDLGILPPPTFSIDLSFAKLTRLLYGIVFGLLLFFMPLSIFLFLVPILDNKPYDLLIYLIVFAVTLAFAAFVYGFYRAGLALLSLCRNQDSIRKTPPFDENFLLAAQKMPIKEFPLNVAYGNDKIGRVFSKFTIAVGVFFLCYWLTMLNWQNNPIFLAAATLCAVGYIYLSSKLFEKQLSPKRQFLRAILSGVFLITFFSALEIVNFGSISLQTFWMAANSLASKENLLHYINAMGIFCGVVGLIEAIFRCFFCKDEKTVSPVAMYSNEPINDADDNGEMPPFPKRWLYTAVIGYAIALVATLIIGYVWRYPYIQAAEYARVGDFTSAIRFDQTNATYFQERGSLRLHRGNSDYELAIEDFTEALRLNPDSDNVLCLRAEAKQRMAEKEPENASKWLASAIEDISEAIRLMPTNWRHKEFRSKLWLAIGDEDKAIGDMKSAIENAYRPYENLSRSALHVQLSEIYEKRSEREMAIREMENAIRAIETISDGREKELALRVKERYQKRLSDLKQ